MEKKNKKVLIIGIIVIILAIVIAIIINNNKDEEKIIRIGEKGDTVQTDEPRNEEFVKVLENGVKLNVSDKISRTREIEGLELKNIQLTSQHSQTQLLSEITNNTPLDKDLMLIDVILYDKEGNEIVSLDGIIGPLKSGESTQLNVSSSLDYANAYDFKIVKKTTK